MSRKLEFCEQFLYLNSRPIRFDQRPYLPAIYAARASRLVLRTSRQVEKTTFLVATLLFQLATRPGIRVLLVAPRAEQSRVIMNSRFYPMLEQSPLLRRVLLGKPAKRRGIQNARFANESQLFVRAAFRTADAARGLSADLLLLDEFQDLAPGALAVLQETQSHSERPQTILVGTPKLLDNQLESAYSLSTANEWTLTCQNCGGVILDERCLGPSGVICPTCQADLDPRAGRWVPRHPESTWGEGFWINHLAVPWINYAEVRDRQRTYDLAQFKNEVLGLPTSLGEHVVTRAELEACCAEQPLAQSLNDILPRYREHLIAGIDWGGGRNARTVIVVGYYRSDRKLVIAHLQPFHANEDPQLLLGSVAEVCRRFRVRWIGADGCGNGFTHNRLLLDKLKHRANLYGIVYSDSDHKAVPDGTLWSWSVDRTRSIGLLYSMVRKGCIEFPRKSECGWYLDELGCELAEHDDEKRRIRYIKPSSQRDDALHATTYAMTMMNGWLDGAGPELVD